MRQHQRRPRGGRSNNNHGSSNQSRKTSRHHVFDSNGPDGKIRGTAQQVYEKYIALARDSASSGDRVTAENHYQHAEHYFRLWSLAAEEEERWAAPNRARFAAEGDDAGYDNAENPALMGDEVAQAAAQAMADMMGDDEMAQPPMRRAAVGRRDVRPQRAPRSADERSAEGRQDRRRDNWREQRRDVRADVRPTEVATEQPVIVDYDAPVEGGANAPAQGGLYQERMNLDRVVSARRETRAPRAPAVRRERRPGPDAGMAMGGQSPVAQLLSEAEAIRESVDA